MKGFKLYMVDKDGNDILLSNYEIGRTTNQMMTFNENLTEAEHDRYDLTFDIVDKPSPLFPITFKLSASLRTGRELKLFKDGELTNYISLIISSINVNLQKENNIYNVTAQDYASYVWSKNNIGLNFDSLTDEEFNNLEIDYNLYNTASYLLSRGQLANPIDTTVGSGDIQENPIPIQTITIETLNDSIWSSDSDLLVYGRTFDEYTRPMTATSNVTINGTIYDFKKIVATYADYTWTNFTKAGEEDWFRYVFNTGVVEPDWGNFLLTNYDSDGNIKHQYFLNREDKYLPIYMYWTQGGQEGKETQPTMIMGKNTQGFLTLSIKFVDKTILDLRARIEIIQFKSDLKNSIEILNGTDSYKFYVEEGKLKYTSPVIDNLTAIDIDFGRDIGYIDFKGSDSWKIDNSWMGDGINIILMLKKINISVSTSNTYNALIELANLTGSLMKINYNTKTIYFYSKTDSEIWNKNYQLKPEFNMQNTGVTVDSSNFSPILFVSGAENEYGLSVGIVDSIPSSAMTFLLNDEGEINEANYLNYYTNKYADNLTWRAAAFSAKQEEATSKFLNIADKIPYLDNFIFSLDYFLGADLLDNVEFMQTGGIFDSIYNTLRKNNYKFQNAIKNKYKFLGEMADIETVLLNFIDEFVADIDEEDKIDKLEKIKNRFSMSIGSLEAGTSEIVNQSPAEGTPTGEDLVTPTYDLTLGGAATQVRILGDSSDHSITNGVWEETVLPFRKIITNFDAEDIWEDTFPVLILEDSPAHIWGWVYDSVASSATILVETYRTLPAAYTEQGQWARTTDTQKYYKSELIDVSYSGYIVSGDTASFNLINFDVTTYSIAGIIEEYGWFELMRLYGGLSYIITKYNEYATIVSDYINEREETLLAIIDIQKSIGSETVPDIEKQLQIEKAWLEKQAEALYDAVGDDTQYFPASDTQEAIIDDSLTGTKYGKYFIMLWQFKIAYTAYMGQTTTPVDPDLTIKDDYYNSYKTRQEIWFNLKKDYGKFLIEGFYENAIETDPVELYNQAILYAYNYNIPQENFSTTMIDISELIGVDITSLQVGDIVTINVDTVPIINSSTIELQVRSISRELRSISNIQLEITKYNETEKLLEKLLLGIKA